MTDYIDHSFRPKLEPLFQQSRHKTTFDRLAVTPNATPVPSMQKQRVALWFGQILNKAGEFPVISTAIDTGVSLRPEGVWFFGSAHQDLVVDSETPFIDMVDSALSVATSVGCALSRLGEKFPSENYPEDPMSLQLFSRRQPEIVVDWEHYVSPL